MRTVFEVGQKYGRLTIVEKQGYDKNSNRLYCCECECGKKITVRGNSLSSGNTKSCGCLSREVKYAKRLPNNEGVINHIILQYKRHAKDRGLSWSLSFEEVEKIIQEPCCYCGTEKSNNKITKNCSGYLHNGIDRINNNTGYETNNVVSCCKICNFAKSDMSQMDFIKWLQKASNHTKAMAEQWGAHI